MQKVMQVVTRAEQVAFKNGRPKESPYMKLSQSTREYGRAMMDASHEYACDNCDSGFETESYMYACRFCYSAGLCGSCHGDIINGKLKTPLCRASHKWLKMPPWNAESHVLSYRRKVWLGASIGKDGFLMEGDLVPASEWLDHLRGDWGFAREDWNFS